ncbi:jg5981 [Pararge aegeria aegeria]|uniref:Jg5981 protein n=1 Tax=Pararge aegeria aegeria TaxID=348720 RepID=A0A8S4S8V2_9NEOP|nr:jg5981 [Pararge aegeria aegeria]
MLNLDLLDLSRRPKVRILVFTELRKIASEQRSLLFSILDMDKTFKIRHTRCDLLHDRQRHIHLQRMRETLRLPTAGLATLSVRASKETPETAQVSALPVKNTRSPAKEAPGRETQYSGTHLRYMRQKVPLPVRTGAAPEKSPFRREDGHKYDEFTLTVAEDKTKTLTCKVCGKAFKNYVNFSQHYRRVHLEIRPKLRACNLCDVKVPNYMRAFHKEEKHGVPAPTCAACGKKFAFPFQVLRHQKFHHMGESKHRCDSCNLSFIDSYGFSRHMLKHKPDKPHKCDICGKCFRWKNNLKTHVLIHGNVRRHVCQVCQEAFVQWTSLQYHMAKKHPNVPTGGKKELGSIQRLRNHSTGTYHDNLLHGSWSLRESRRDHFTQLNFNKNQYMGRNIQKYYRGVDFIETVDGDGIKKFTCNVCNKAFKEKRLVSQHYNFVHLKKRPKARRCHLCNVKLAVSMYAFHMETHGIPAPSCGACEKKFAFPWQLVRHQKFFHLGESKFQCEFCDKLFLDSPSLKKHMAKHKPDRPFKCDECEKGFKLRKTLRTHVTMVHGKPCISNKTRLTAHFILSIPNLKYHHVVEIPTTRTKRFDSSFLIRNAKAWNALPSSVFPDTYNLGTFKSRVNRHLLGKLLAHRTLIGQALYEDFTKTVDGDGMKTFTCNVCDKTFKKRQLFAQHFKQVHLKQRPKLRGCHLCDVKVPTHMRAFHMEEHGLPAPFCAACGKKFAQKSQVLRHQKFYHMGESKYRCEPCDLSFIHNYALRRHMAKHKPDKPFKCNVCDKSFRWKKNLHTHVMIHGNVRPHVCKVCDEAFVQTSSLKYHMSKTVYDDYTETVDGDADGTKSLTCNSCSKIFRKYSYFAQHYRQVHLRQRPKLRSCNLCDVKVPDHMRAFHMDEKHGLPAPYCAACGKKFAFPFQVLRHQKFHHMGESEHRCELCKVACVNRSKLVEHKRTHEPDYRPFRCEICNKTFRWQKNLKTHMMIHTNSPVLYDDFTGTFDEAGGKTFTCNACGKVFGKRGNFSQHYRQVHLKQRPKLRGCRFCDVKVSPNLRAFHMEKHGLPAPSCGVCGKKFARPSEVLSHQRFYHMGEANYRCEPCDIGFMKNSGLQRHMAKHKSDKPFKCELCHKSYKWRNNLRTHIMVHTNVRPYVCQLLYKDFKETVAEDGQKAIQCNVCERVFKKRGNFAQHYRQVHLKQRPKLRGCHLCDTKVPDWMRAFHMEDKHGLPAPSCGACGKKFAFPWKVLRHQKFHHMGESQFRCELCDMSFISRWKLEDHQKKHKPNYRPFKCDVCEKSFRWPNNLKTHMNIHSNIRPHVCKHCGGAFSQHSSLNYHLKSVHPETV